MMDMGIKDKILMLLEKAGISTELVSKIKEELSKEETSEGEVPEGEGEGEVKAKVVAVKIEGKPTLDEIDKMSEQEVKDAFKKHLEMMSKGGNKPTIGLAEKMKKMMY